MPNLHKDFEVMCHVISASFIVRISVGSLADMGSGCQPVRWPFRISVIVRVLIRTSDQDNKPSVNLSSCEMFGPPFSEPRLKKISSFSNLLSGTAANPTVCGKVYLILLFMFNFIPNCNLYLQMNCSIPRTPCAR